MNRRRLLASAGMACVSLAGCLGGTPANRGNPGSEDTSPPTDLDYETCDREVIFYSELTETLRHEVDVALEEGEYVADEVFLASAMNVETAYLQKSGDYYEPVVDGTRLELRHDEKPTLPRRRVLVENDTDETHTVTLSVVATDRETLAEATVTVGPGKRGVGVEVSRVGSHTLVVERDDGTNATHNFTIGPSAFGGILSLDELEFIQAVAELAPCPWSG